MYDADKVKEDFNVSPVNFLMYKKLMGDSSDNVSGIDGIGKKKFDTDLSFLKEDIEVTDDILFEHIEQQIEFRKEDKKKPLKYQLDILESKDILELNEKVMSLHDVQMSGDAKLRVSRLLDIKPNALNKSGILLAYMNDGLSSAIPNINEWLLNTFSTLNSFILQDGEVNGIR